MTEDRQEYDAVGILHDQVKASHEFLESTMDGVTEDQVHWIPKGKANPIGATYAHLLFTEDFMANKLFARKDPLYASEWKDKTGIDVAMPLPGAEGHGYEEWTKSVKLSLPKVKKYAKAVFNRTEEFVSGLRPEDLKKKVDLSGMGIGDVSLGYAIGRFLVGHADNITGEISSLKGIQGLKGYPV